MEPEEGLLNDKPPKGKKIRYIRLSEGKSVSFIQKQSDHMGSGQETGTEHPTQKPVELAIRAIDNSSKPGDLSLISLEEAAAHSSEQRWLAEMQHHGARPRYCDVIINRYVRFTGNVGVTCERDGKELQYVQLKEDDKLNSIHRRGLK